MTMLTTSKKIVNVKSDQVSISSYNMDLSHLNVVYYLFVRLLLWDCDDRSYSYYIEVSTNQREWELVCDRTREPCKGWQHVKFDKRPVAFFRIVGTHNTANEVSQGLHH